MEDILSCHAVGKKGADVDKIKSITAEFFVKQLRLLGALISLMPAHCHTAMAHGDTCIGQSRRKCY